MYDIEDCKRINDGDVLGYGQKNPGILPGSLLCIQPAAVIIS